MNPYKPPSPLGSTAQANRRHPYFLLMAGLASGHCLSTVAYLSAYAQLVRVGSVSPLAAMLGLAACLLLYVAVLQMPSNSARARKLFLFAIVAFALSIMGWSIRYGLSHVFWVGVPHSVLGYWLARRMEGH
jgi:hypothetical protein